ncbi:hypothetical protein BDN70DRAFT_381121 [Pholiota conissans]|uniref:Nephrocystin 3-like N-terminal domain-containing protein n=1 Tax=Pholiota conissans TaxID=109636 RepID=A0A9P5Z8H5_9AGAR|nr:hypothetical protein BDN70DRAFT_381121 [Pholiota conissans]
MIPHHQASAMQPSRASTSNLQLFPGASNVNIHGGQFTAVGGDMHWHSSDMQRYGLKLLLENISRGAFHNAAERGDPPRCHPHTRASIRNAMMTWIKASAAHRKLIVWLYGPAGAGKTAIEQSIAEQCEREGLLGASFFFGRTAAGRNDTSRFAATIAYQLAISIPEAREQILGAIEKDLAIFSRSLEVQMRVLVIEPLTFAHVRMDRPTSPMAILVDGVDECGPNGDAQIRLLSALGAAADELQHIPIIFLVASRPEFEIRLAFNQEPLRSLMRGIFLDKNYQSNNDIHVYLTSKFQEIRQYQLALGIQVPPPWPTASDMTRLVNKSSGHFLFAATVVKFVNSPRRDPVDRLNIILGMSDAGKETPFAALDALYHFVLSGVDDLVNVLRVLTLLMLGGDYSNMLTVGVVECLLGIQVNRILMDMHALVFVPPINNPAAALRMHHASLGDFLMDQSRSGEFFIDTKKGHVKLAKYWLDMISNYPQPRAAGAGLHSFISNFAFHAAKAFEGGRYEVADYLSTFSLSRLLERIQNPNDLYSDKWSVLFKIAEKQKGIQSNILLRFQNEFYTFFIDRIRQYPSLWRPLIPAVVVWAASYGRHYFSKLLVMSCDPDAVDQVKELDRKTLMLYDTNHGQDDSTCIRDPFMIYSPYSTFFRELFMQRQESGRDRIRESRAAFATKIVQTFWHSVSEPPSEYPELLITLLPMCPKDPDIGSLLLENTLQYRYNNVTSNSAGNNKGYSDTDERIARESHMYLHRYSLLPLEHTHRPNTNICVICRYCYGASVVDHTSSNTGSAATVATGPCKPTEMTQMIPLNGLSTTTDSSIGKTRKRECIADEA